MKKLTHFSLFTGIGGIDLAAEWAGFETVGQCEFADYPTKVLEKHWPDVPRWRDIRDVNLESVRNKGIRTIDLITGGFPCQPFSVAGKQRGKEDDRYLWPEMLRVIEELRPAWVIGENVVGIVRMALDQVLFDLESKGYTAIPVIIPACSVDAPHRRGRVFIIAYSTSKQSTTGIERETWQKKQGESGGVGGKEDIFPYANSERRRLRNTKREDAEDVRESSRRSAFREWDTEPNVGRVVNGISSRVDRLKCLGNAVVPAQVYPILKAIADIERKNT